MLESFLACSFGATTEKEWLHERGVNVVSFETRSRCDPPGLGKLGAIGSGRHCLSMNKNIDMQVPDHLATYLRIGKESGRMYENEWMFHGKSCRRGILDGG